MMAAPPNKKSPKSSAYYRRPSAALERGGGFYVPGLEGSRLRVAVASILSVGLVLNRILSPGTPTSSQVASEVLGAVGIAFVFAQSVVQSRLEAEIEADELRSALVSRLSEVQETGPSLADGSRPPLAAARAKWAAAALLRLTPARAAVWVASDGEVLLRFGRFPDDSGAASGGDGEALLSTLRSSRPASQPEAAAWSVELGSAAAPPPHPLPSNSESAAICQCGGGVLALASERPAAFSAEHLQSLERCKLLIEMA